MKATTYFKSYSVESFSEKELDLLQTQLVYILFGDHLSSSHALSPCDHSLTHHSATLPQAGLRRQNPH